jgi:hypothetical protein
MEESVLLSTKKILGISPDDDAFDLDVITHINSAISILEQVGIPNEGYIQDDEPTWGDVFAGIVDDPNRNQLQLIRTIVYLQVRLLFDPPATSFLIAATQEQIREHIWRLNVRREDIEYVDPDPPGVVLDG